MANQPAKSRPDPVRPAVLETSSANLVERQAVSSSSEFLEWVRQRKTLAERRKADLLTEIAQFEADIQRSKEDHDTLTARLDTEIRARMLAIDDEEQVIRRAEVALTIELEPAAVRPAPQLHGTTPPASLEEALSQTHASSQADAPSQSWGTAGQ